MVKHLARTLAAWVIAATAAFAWAGTAGADGYRGAPFSAEAWFGPDGALELRYKLYVGAKGYRLEAVRPIEGPDIIIAQFAVPQFVYIDLNTGSVNFLPMGENDWGRFHGIACADFEYRKNWAPQKWRAGPPRSGSALAALDLWGIPESGGIRRSGISCGLTSKATSPNLET